MPDGLASTLEALFAASDDLVVATARDGRVVYRNPAAEATGAGAITTASEWTDGARWFTTVISPLEDGNLCISRDVTALKRTEQRLRQSEKMLVDAQGVAHLGTWEWDISQPNASWSAELYRIYGLTPETYTPSYEAYLTMVHPDDRQRVIDATNRAFHDHVEYSHDERIFRPDGTLRHLHTWAYPVLDGSGTLTHLIGVCQDITDRAEAEEALQRANAELEQRVAERTRELEGFNSMVSHDLRAPLSVIQMAAEMVGKDESRAATYVPRILRAVENMSRLMDNLLQFARLGDAALQPRELDVSHVCAEIVTELRAAAPDRSATVTIEPSLRCVADPALFRVVLVNLLGNAWKYTQRTAQARIEIGMTEHASARALFVRDNGVGFDMSEYPRLFAPFERLASAKDFVGTGVGLASVKRIVERHGGTISAESRPDEGSTFFVRLP